MKYFLYPFSLIYGCIVYVRNWLFDKGVLSSFAFDHPVLSVGNITVGGTGKTPHVEYLIRLLRKQAWHVAVLSRGYGRSTNGFIALSSTAQASEVGDEPLQMKRKYPDVTVAVDEKRVDGVTRLLAMDRSIDVIVLDDAYQHRYIKPSLSILLIDSTRPIDQDCLLPAGRLRESAVGITRADVVILTKCPSTLIPSIQESIYRERLQMRSHQQLFFTTIVYDDKLRLVGDSSGECRLGDIPADAALLLVTGIASPVMLHDEMKKYFAEIELLTFPDHYTYTANAMRRIQTAWEKMGDRKKYILTTEKDAMRFRDGIAAGYTFYRSLYYLPIRILFLGDGEETFNQTINDHVSNYQRNR